MPVALLGLVGVLGLRVWWGWHVVRVTGRTDLPRVSCLYCHRTVVEPVVGGPPRATRYASPVALTLSADGRRLFVAAHGSDRLLEVDLAARAVTRSVELGAGPLDVALSPDGRRLAVACRDADEVALLDAQTLVVERAVPTGAEPTAVAFDAGGDALFVAEGTSGDVTLVPLSGAGADAVGLRLAAGKEPYALASGADALLAVVSRRASPGPMDAVPSAELTLIDVGRGRVRERRALVSAHLGEDVVLTPDGAWALAPVVHIRNLLPITQVARGAVMNSALALVETRPGGVTVQFPLDEVNAGFADPGDVAVTPDGRIAFVAHHGANVVTALDLEALVRLALEATPAEREAYADDLTLHAEYVLARIATHDAPGALAMAKDGERLYVAERLADTVAVIDVATLELVERIELGGPRELTRERLGERVFHDASITFQGQFSCSSCHPDGHTDGLIWDFEIDGIGQNLLETRSLRGIRDTAPFKWNGKNPDLATQCGPRFARVLTRSDPFSPAQLEQLVAYIESIPLRSRRAAPDRSDARARGKELFFRTRTTAGLEIAKKDRCDTCHRPPLFTDRLKGDVGTGAAFDTPHLLDLAASGPYLHDGRARTLEEIWTVHSTEDTHGATNDLTKVELNDLMAFLRSL